MTAHGALILLMGFLFLFLGYMGVPVAFALIASVLVVTAFTPVSQASMIARGASSGYLRTREFTTARPSRIRWTSVVITPVPASRASCSRCQSVLFVESTTIGLPVRRDSAS